MSIIIRHIWKGKFHKTQDLATRLGVVKYDQASPPISMQFQTFTYFYLTINCNYFNCEWLRVLRRLVCVGRFHFPTQPGFRFFKLLSAGFEIEMWCMANGLRIYFPWRKGHKSAYLEPTLSLLDKNTVIVAARFSRGKRMLWLQLPLSVTIKQKRCMNHA